MSIAVTRMRDRVQMTVPTLYGWAAVTLTTEEAEQLAADLLKAARKR